MIDPAGYSFVSVTVDIDGESQTEVLAVLNHANKVVSQPDSFQVNTLSAVLYVVRCMALGDIYAGEDLPEGVESTVTVESSTGEKKDIKEWIRLPVFNTFIPECKDWNFARLGHQQGAIET